MAAIVASGVVTMAVILTLPGTSGDNVRVRAFAAAPPPPDVASHPPVYPSPGGELPPLPTTPTLLSHGGPAVTGALVSFSLAGLQAHAGQEISLVVHNGEGAETRYTALVEGNGTALVNVYLPHVLHREGPCSAPAPCRLWPVGPGPLGVKVMSPPEAGAETLIETQITVVGSTSGHLYPVEMLRECGPDRVELGGDVWVPAPGAVVPDVEGRSVPGVFFYGLTAARYTPAGGTPVNMTRVGRSVLEPSC